ncbi:MAG: hypothetical protein ACKOQ1_08780, partial [Actinomycetota bacterium]
PRRAGLFHCGAPSGVVVGQASAGVVPLGWGPDTGWSPTVGTKLTPTHGHDAGETTDGFA